MRSAQTAIAALTLATTAALACEISSGPQTNALVELYTSEGCSSCPPADRWLSSYVRKPTPNAVVLAFHVDYWDYLGWRDRFDSPRFSDRQRELVEAGGGRTVYTPQLFVDAADRASWRQSNSVSEAISKVNQHPAEAQLTLKLDAVPDKTAGKAWIATLSGNIKRPASSQQVWLAVYQDGLSSQVAAGENSGARLQHDRVVRQWLGPFKADAAGRINVAQSLGVTEAFDPAQAGVAAFVEDKRAGKVLQAVSLPFCGRS
jgi:hypothetical protein